MSVTHGFFPRAFRGGVAAVFLMLPLCLFCALSATAPASTAQVVRVGFPNQTALSETDENGVRSGHTYEYLMEISQYTGWEYEFIDPPGDSLSEKLTSMLGMLEKGELDIVGGMRKTPELEQLYGYSAYQYLTSSATLLVLGENSEINPANYYSKPNLRVAALEGATRQNGLLEQFCELNSFSPTIVYCKDDAEQLSLLQSGEADILLSRDLAPVEGTRVIAKFAPEPVFFATPKGSGLLNQLNYALLSIEHSSPNFPTMVYNKYFQNDTFYELNLSKGEQSFVALAGPITVGILPGNDPIAVFNTKTGEASGIMVDILATVEEKTGLQFRYSGASNTAAFKSMAAKGDFDIIAGMEYDYNLAKSYDVIMTQPFFPVPFVRVENILNSSKNGTFGFVSELQYVVDNVTSADVGAVYYYTPREAVLAAKNGDVEASYMGSYIANKIISDNNFNEMSVSPVPGKEMELCLGIGRHLNRQLISIMDKGLYSLSEQDISSAVYKNTLSSQSMTLQRLITLYPLQSIIAAALVFLLIIILLSLFLRRTTRLKNDLAANNSLYMRLCELVGEVVCEYKYSTDLLSVSGTNSLGFFSKTSYEHFRSDYPASCTELPTTEQALARLLKDEPDDEVRLLCVLPDQKKRWLCINHQVVKNKNKTNAFLICKITDVTDEMNALESLTTKAQTDNLTGLYNVATFRSLVCGHLKDSAPHSRGMFIILDIDNFKGINDSFGHFEGDVVLARVAGALRSTFRDNDYVGRLGGDEFVAFSPGLCDNFLIAEKCRSIMTSCASISEKITVTVSIGAVKFEGDVDFEKLYKQADRCLYRVKQSGRNGYEIDYI